MHNPTIHLLLAVLLCWGSLFCFVSCGDKEPYSIGRGRFGTSFFGESENSILNGYMSSDKFSILNTNKSSQNKRASSSRGRGSLERRIVRYVGRYQSVHRKHKAFRRKSVMQSSKRKLGLEGTTTLDIPF